jgi:hypothetical protein
MDLGKTNIKLRFKEPHLTEGMNERLFGVSSRGVLRGFEIQPDVAARSVKLVVDAGSSDSVAVIELSTGYQVRARLSANTASISLAAFPDFSTVLLVLVVDYAVAGETAFDLYAYSLADYLAAADKEYLCVLGEVTLPAGAVVIPAANITEHYRQWHFLGAPRGVDDYQRMGLGRSRLSYTDPGGTKFSPDKKLFSFPSAADTALEVFDDSAAGVDGGCVFHFDMWPVPFEAATYKAFYMPLTGRVPVADGDKVVVDFSVKVADITFNPAFAAGGGVTRLGLRVLFFDVDATAIDAFEGSIDLKAELGVAPYSTGGVYNRYTRTFNVPSTARYAFAYLECYGMALSIVAPATNYIRVAYADVYTVRTDKSRGSEFALGGRSLDGTSLLLHPIHEPIVIERAFDDSGEAYPYGAGVNPITGIYLYVDVEDDGTGKPVGVLKVDTLNGGAPTGAGLCKVRFASNYETYLGSVIDATVITGAFFKTTGSGSTATASIITQNGQLTIQALGSGKISLLAKAGGLEFLTTLAGKLTFGASGTGEVEIYTVSGDILLESRGVGKFEIFSQSGGLFLGTTGGGDLGISSDGRLDLTGHVDDYVPAVFHGVVTNGANVGKITVLRETVGAAASGVVVKLVEDIKACVPAEDILYEEEFVVLAAAAFAVVPLYYMWVKYPYCYVKGGSPLLPANWHEPTIAEIDISGSVLGAHVDSATVVKVSKSGFLVAFVADGAVVAGDDIECRLKWKFVPA